MSSPAPEAAQIEAALEELLAWSETARSPRLGQFLSYIVKAKLAGREEAIKAYSIAVDVFGRPASFDPQADPIVRVQARRLRALLDRFYAEDGGSGPVRIRLPVGRYVPEFEFCHQAVPADGSPVEQAGEPLPVAQEGKGAMALPSSRDDRAPLFARLLAGFTAVAAIIGSLLVFQPWVRGPEAIPVLRPPDPPRIVVQEFANRALGTRNPPRVSGLALELVTDLTLFDDIDAAYAPQLEDRETLAQGATDRPSFVLSGEVRISGSSARYHLALRMENGQRDFWRHVIALPLDQAHAPEAIDKVSREAALLLGSHSGPLHVRARRWAESGVITPEAVSPYLCVILFDFYRDTGLMRDANDARACIAALDEPDRTDAAALATLGALQADAAANGWLNSTGREELFMLAEKSLSAAVAASPLSSFVWEQQARLQELRGSFEQARAAYASALQLNPANANALASFGRMLAFTPDWAEGRGYAALALEASPNPPHWYYVAPALNALREGRFALAMSYAENVVQVDPALGSLVALVGASESGNREVAKHYLAQIAEGNAFAERGILAELRRRIFDPQLVELIGMGLRRAGVPPETLSAALPASR